MMIVVIHASEASKPSAGARISGPGNSSILQNSDIPFLSKELGIRNNSYSVKGIGTQEVKFCIPISFQIL